MTSAVAITLFRFLISGVLGFLVNLGVYSFLVYTLQVWYVEAAVVAFLVALCVSFFLQKIYTFKEYSRVRSLRQFLLYAAFILFNLCVSTSLLFVFISGLGIGKITGLIIANAIIAVWSFFVYERIIFRIDNYIQPTQSRFPLGAARISVVIPCHNEEESIAAVLAAIPKGVFEVIVVDNNCADSTASIAVSLGARVISESVKGYGAALKAGFQAARGDIIAAFDGDNQYPAGEVLAMARLLIEQDLDFISATRFPLASMDSMNLQRRIGNWGLTFACNILFSLSLFDSQSGMWVFRRAALKRVLPAHNDMPFSQEIKIRAATDSSMRFAEYGITYHPRLGESKLAPWRHGFMLLWHMFKMRIISSV